MPALLHPGRRLLHKRPIPVVRDAIDRYRQRYDLPPLRRLDVEARLPEPTVSDFIGHVEAVGVEKFAADVLRNRMRTSSRSGILKAAAALDYTRILRVTCQHWLVANTHVC